MADCKGVFLRATVNNFISTNSIEMRVKFTLLKSMSCKCCFGNLMNHYNDSGDYTFDNIEVPEDIVNSGLYKMEYNCEHYEDGYHGYEYDETFTIKRVDNG